MEKMLYIILFLVCSIGYAQTNYAMTDDGFPTGQSTPEGVACDAVRAYISSDHELWLSILVPSFIYGDENNPKGAENIKKYEEFKKMMIEKKKHNAKDPDFPKMKIKTIYKARNFSKNGPGSLAYSMFEFTGNMFVDIVVDMGNEKPLRARYHVMQDKNKKWYFEPRPDLTPLLSMGLNEETASTVEWKKE